MKSAEEIIDLYLTKNWKIIPLLGKKRITKETETVDIRQYYHKFDKYNVGLLTGEKSGIVVVDCDRSDNERVKAFNTRGVKTPNGWHYFFKIPKYVTIRNAQDIFNTRDKGYQVDIRGEGGYVVVPPSQGYQWLNDEPIKDLPKDLELMLTQTKQVNTSKEVIELPKSGGRHMWFLRLAGKLAKRKFTKEETGLFLEAVNERLDNSLEVKDLLGIIDRVYNAEHRSREKDGYLNHIKELQEHKGVEYSTSITGLDKLTWGLYPGCLHVWTAYSQTGKTAIALKSAVMNAKAGKRVLFFPTESNKFEVQDRICTMFGNINGQKFVEGNFDPEELQRIKHIKSRLDDMDFFVCDVPRPSLSDIEAWINKYNPDIVYIDFFQRCNFSGGTPGENWQQVRNFAQSIKDIAKLRDIPILVLSQVNSEKFYNKEKSKWCRAECSFWNARGGESIGHEADTGLSMNKYTNSQGEEFVKFHYEKSRKTRKGTIYTKFDGKYLLFTEISGIDFEAGIQV